MKIIKGNFYKYNDEFEKERLVDILEALENSKKFAKKTLMYSPKLRANILVFNNRLYLHKT